MDTTTETLISKKDILSCNETNAIFTAFKNNQFTFSNSNIEFFTPQFIEMLSQKELQILFDLVDTMPSDLAKAFTMQIFESDFDTEFINKSSYLWGNCYKLLKESNLRAKVTEIQIELNEWYQATYES
jgi:hypothetical protein